MHKKASLPILALVVLTAILVTSAIMAFYVNSSNNESKIQDFSALDEIALKKDKIDFYVNEIIEKSFSRIDRNSDIKMQFITNFNEELIKYKKDGNYILEELSQVEGKVNEQSAELKDGKLYISLSFKLESSQDKIIISSLYDKKFIRII